LPVTLCLSYTNLGLSGLIMPDDDERCNRCQVPAEGSVHQIPSR
jgi:hypothetical protein